MLVKTFQGLSVLSTSALNMTWYNRFSLFLSDTYNHRQDYPRASTGPDEERRDFPVAFSCKSNQM